LAPVLFCYAKSGETAKADEMLQKMVGLRPRNRKEGGMVAEGVQNILHAYRMIVNDPKKSRLQKEKALECAEVLTTWIDESSLLKGKSHSEFHTLHMNRH